MTDKQDEDCEEDYMEEEEYRKRKRRWSNKRRRTLAFLFVVSPASETESRTNFEQLEIG